MTPIPELPSQWIDATEHGVHFKLTQLPSGRVLALALTALSEAKAKLLEAGFASLPARPNLMHADPAAIEQAGRLMNARWVEFDYDRHFVTMLSAVPSVPEPEPSAEAGAGAPSDVESPSAGEGDDADEDEDAAIDGDAGRDQEIATVDERDAPTSRSQAVPHVDVGSVRGLARKDIANALTDIITASFEQRTGEDLRRSIITYDRDALWPAKSAGAHKADGRSIGAALIYDRIRASFQKNATETGRPRRIYPASWGRLECFLHTIRWSRALFESALTVDQASEALWNWQRAFTRFEASTTRWARESIQLSTRSTLHGYDGYRLMAGATATSEDQRAPLLALAKNSNSASPYSLLQRKGEGIIKSRGASVPPVVPSFSGRRFTVENPLEYLSEKDQNVAAGALHTLGMALHPSVDGSAIRQAIKQLTDLGVDEHIYLTNEDGHLIGEYRRPRVSPRHLDLIHLATEAEKQGPAASGSSSSKTKVSEDKKELTPNQLVVEHLRSRRTALEYHTNGNGLVDVAKVRATRNAAGEIDGLDLLAEWGFRGIEYGNWVPQVERAEHLSQIDQAFADLQLISGWPARAMNLNGELGIGIGSRGRGGVKHPPAFYQPGNHAMVFTRLMGVGSLAHEFGHALDHHLGGGNLVAEGKKYRGNYLSRSIFGTDRILTSPASTTDEELQAWIESGPTALEGSKRTAAHMLLVQRAMSFRHPDTISENEWTAISGLAVANELRAISFVANTVWRRLASAEAGLREVGQVDAAAVLSAALSLRLQDIPRDQQCVRNLTTRLQPNSFIREGDPTVMSLAIEIAESTAARASYFEGSYAELGGLSKLAGFMDSTALHSLSEAAEALKDVLDEGAITRTRRKALLDVRLEISALKREILTLPKAIDTAARAFTVKTPRTEIEPCIRGIQLARLAGLSTPEVNHIINERKPQWLGSFTGHNLGFLLSTHFELASTASDVQDDSNYWATPHEMFARAFEAWITHELGKHDIQTRYLTSVEAIKPRPPEDREFLVTSNNRSIQTNDQMMRFMIASFAYPDQNDAHTLFPAMERFIRALEVRPAVVQTADGKDSSVEVLYSRDTSMSVKVSDLDAATRRQEAIEAVRMMLGKTARVHAVRRLEGDVSGATVRRMLDNQALVMLASENRRGQPIDLMATGHHEAMHVAYGVLFTTTEQDLLRRAFENPKGVWVQRTLKAAEASITSPETRLRVMNEIRTNPEEAMAYAFQFYAAGAMRGDLPAGVVAGFIDRFALMIERIAGLVRGHGFKAPCDLFDDLRSGAVARRADSAAPAAVLIVPDEPRVDSAQPERSAAEESEAEMAGLSP